MTASNSPFEHHNIAYFTNYLVFFTKQKHLLVSSNILIFLDRYLSLLNNKLDNHHLRHILIASPLLLLYFNKL